MPLLRGERRRVRSAVFAYDQAEYSADRLCMSMVRSGPWKFVQHHAGAPELYHLDQDPAEFRNLYAEADSRAAADELRDMLLRWHVACSGGFYAKESARFWEDETAFYDEARFCGQRLEARGDSPA